MEAMYGKWEAVPSLTENFDEFCEKAGCLHWLKYCKEVKVTIFADEGTRWKPEKSSFKNRGCIGINDGATSVGRKLDVPEDKREAYRNMVTIVLIEKSGKGVRVIFEVKGTPIKQDVTFEEGVPKTYKVMDGEEVTSNYTVKGNRMYDQFMAVKDGKTITWDVERYVDGDMLVTIQTKNGVSMITKMKRI